MELVQDRLNTMLFTSFKEQGSFKYYAVHQF
jgi:hypothetical protein